MWDQIKIIEIFKLATLLIRYNIVRIKLFLNIHLIRVINDYN